MARNSRTSRRKRGREDLEQSVAEVEETMDNKPKSVCSEALGEKPEVQVLRQHFAKLCQGIQDPLNLAVQLYSEGVITKTVLGCIRNTSGTEKELILLEAVSDQVAIEPGKFTIFLNLLSKEAHLSSLAHSMEQQMRSKSAPLLILLG